MSGNLFVLADQNLRAQVDDDDGASVRSAPKRAEAARQPLPDAEAGAPHRRNGRRPRPTLAEAGYAHLNRLLVKQSLNSYMGQ